MIDVMHRPEIPAFRRWKKEVQKRHPQIHVKVKASLSWTRPYLRRNEKFKSGSVKMRPSSWPMYTCLGVPVCAADLQGMTQWQELLTLKLTYREMTQRQGLLTLKAPLQL